MLDDLIAINEQVAQDANAMRRMVAQPATQDRAETAALRLRFSRSLRRHLQFIDLVVMPEVQKLGRTERARAAEVRAVLQRYHEAAAHHVAAWPSEKLQTEWAAYGSAVRRMLDLLQERTEIEQRLLYPILRQAKLQSTTPA